MNTHHLTPIATVLEIEPCGFPACRGLVKRMAEYDLLSSNILFFYMTSDIPHSITTFRLFGRYCVYLHFSQNS